MHPLALLGFLLTLSTAASVDYLFTVLDDSVKPCPGEEDSFFDKFFDYEHLDFSITDDAILLNGYARFIEDIPFDEIFSLKLEVQRNNRGHWISSPLSMNRVNICKYVFQPTELWYDFFKDFTGDARLCPLKKNTKYEFHNKTLSTTIKNGGSGMEGYYRAITIVESPSVYFCTVLEGDLIRK